MLSDFIKPLIPDIKEENILILMIICVAGIIYMSFLNYVIPKMRRADQLKERMQRYGIRGVDEWRELSRIDVRQLKKAKVKNRLEELLKSKKSWVKDIQYLLYRSGVIHNFRPQILTFCLLSLLLAVLGKFTTHLSLFSLFFISTLSSFSLHLMQLKAAANAWQKKFIRLFPLCLDIIIRGLKSGLTLGRGIAMVSEEMEDPVGTEFHYVVSQLQLGIPVEFAFHEAAERIGTDDFRIFSVALIVQKEMGGSLTDILTKLVDVVRDREKFRNKVWTLSSEARASALIVSSLPIFTAIGLELITPGYLRFFIDDITGVKLLMTAVSLNVTGFIIIARMIRFDH